MGTLLNRGGRVARNRYLLMRDKTTGLLRTTPWWFSVSSLTYATGYGNANRYVSWRSPDYFPTPPPGAYGRSACHAGLLSTLGSTPWGGNSLGGWVTASWTYELHTGETFSRAYASLLAEVYDMSYWANFYLKKIRYVCTDRKIDAGGGAATLSIRTSNTASRDTSLEWLYTDLVFNVPNVATHTYEVNLQLNRYLIFCQFIDNLAPATEPFLYPTYHETKFRGYLSHLLLE